MSGLGTDFAATITDGSLWLAMAVAVVVGVISFLSPCVLPLVPGYLSYVAGLAGSSADRAEETGPDPAAAKGANLAVQERSVGRRRVLLGSGLFVLGFSAVFISFGALFGGLGRLLLEWAPVINPALGVLTIVMGLAFLGLVPQLQRELRIHRLPRTGLAGAPLLGVVFGVGWTPCLGPTLGAINTLALTQASALRGAVLGLAYCVGLGIPFLLVAAGADRMMRLSAAARRHAKTVTRVGGGLLVLLGLMLVTGTWEGVMIWLRAWLAATGLGTSAL